MEDFNLGQALDQIMLVLVEENVYIAVTIDGDLSSLNTLELCERVREIYLGLTHKCKNVRKNFLKAMGSDFREFEDTVPKYFTNIVMAAGDRLEDPTVPNPREEDVHYLLHYGYGIL